jgi:LytS/YehU family sensor histidine kinase
MLLITLVENSFKHGVTKTTGSAWIHLDISVDANKTVVSLINSASPANMSGPDGVGLSSIRGQLNMLYRDKASFLIKSHEDSFEVKLELAESI